MKHIVISAACLAAPLHAESLCDVTDMAVIIDALQGDWSLEGQASIETQTLSQVRPAQGTATFSENRPTIRIVEGAAPTVGALTSEGMIYDVDQVDDILETVEGDWMADDLSATPCGPEGLLQLTLFYTDLEREAQLTVLPYFDDQMLVIIESEITGSWGLAFVTYAGILTRGDTPSIDLNG